MNKKSKKDKLSPVRKAIIGVILAFIAEKLLSPLCEFLFALFLGIGGGLIKAISNMTYRQISNGYDESGVRLIIYILVVATLAVAYIAFFNVKKRKDDILAKVSLGEKTAESSEENTQNSSKTDPADTIEVLRKNISRDFVIFSISIIICISALLFTYMQYTYSNSIITKTTNNIEIVSPYISDLEYKQLKSDFHTLESADDYKKLQEKLQTIAESNDIKLKK